MAFPDLPIIFVFDNISIIFISHKLPLRSSQILYDYKQSVYLNTLNVKICRVLMLNQNIIKNIEWRWAFLQMASYTIQRRVQIVKLYNDNGRSM